MQLPIRTLCWLCGAVLTIVPLETLRADAAASPGESSFMLKLRSRIETSANSGLYHAITKPEEWIPRRTAIIVCDVWDLHHCLNAVRRGEEFAPRLQRLLEEARRQGATIIHAPSGCMEAYKSHPARLRAQAVSKAGNLPKDIGSWCSRIPAEERGKYPIDQSDGGEDDDPAEHKAWAASLQKLGRNPGSPWKKQTDLLTIADTDYISDQGDEVWSILERNRIDGVILTGVHTNMCVLGRPFGLRQLAKNGKRVVLMRDLTDTMYNPQRWPYVNHFTGTDLIVEHIEKFVCPTVTSDQILGGRPFRFHKDTRPHVVVMIGEDEYETHKTLPVFASDYLGKDFRVTLVLAGEKNPNDFPGLEVLEEADLLLVSVRRRPLPPEQLAMVQKFVRSGKPVLGIRTASHAFSLRANKLSDKLAAWPDFDREVFGGNYHGHHDNRDPNGQPTFIRAHTPALASPILTGIGRDEFGVRSSLYKTSPLAAGTHVLLMGRAGNLEPHEPAAWTFTRRDGGRSFYTSLGHVGDFALPAFRRLLLNATYWAAELPIPKELPTRTARAQLESHWNRVAVPGTWQALAGAAPVDSDLVAWYRCLVMVPARWAGKPLGLSFRKVRGADSVYVNGREMRSTDTTRDRVVRRAADVSRNYSIPAEAVEAGELNLVAVRLRGDQRSGLLEMPELFCGQERLSLCGAWQFRFGDDPAWATLALPAKFAAATDVIFELREGTSR